MVVLDTNIIIDHLRSSQKTPSLLEQFVQRHQKELLAVSVLSIQELYEGASTRDEIKEKQLLATIAPLRILSYTYEIAVLAGKVARDLGRPIELADTAIAATTVSNGATLLTLNRKDFIGIPDLVLEEL